MSEASLFRSLAGFVTVLRRLGIRAGTSETTDAMAAVALVDVLSRDQVAAALSATLVKDRSLHPVFMAAFDDYFRAHPIMPSVSSSPAEELELQGRPLDLSPEVRRAYSQLGEPERERVREFLRRTSAGHKVGPQHDRLIVELVAGHLRRMGGTSRDVALIDVTGDPECDALLERIGQTLADADEVPLAFRDLGTIQPEDRDLMATAVRRLARRLATGLGRRYRSSARRRRVDIRATVRANIRFGGVPIRLKYRTRDTRKPRLLVLADVSGSMTRYSEFILMFVDGLIRVVSGLECFAFTSDLVPLTNELRGARAGAVATALDRAASVHGATTNLGQALSRLLSEHSQSLTTRTLVLVVSDTKTQAITTAAQGLAEVARRARSVLWLNTIPRSRWDRLPAVPVLSRHCVMRECYTLSHLDQIMRDALGSL